MKVFILSKQEFDRNMANNNITNDNVEERTNAFFISINDTCGTSEVPYFENKENVLVLYFDDVEQDLETKLNGKPVTAKAFTLEQGRQVLDFIEKHKDKKTCIVHCAAGISRSGAVGTFVNDYFAGDYFKFKQDNPYIHPNGIVLKHLRQALSDKNDVIGQHV